MINKKIYSIIIFMLYLGCLKAQTYKVHSHNDYLQSVPFWKAYSSGAASIEVDIFLNKGSLLVAHTYGELSNAKSLEQQYLRPLAQSFELGLKEDSVQLLIDIKSEAYATLDALIDVLKGYPSIIQNKSVTLIVSGNKPKIADYVNYPKYIYFDYQSLSPIEDPKTLEKIALISLNFRKFTQWNGLGRLTKDDLKRVSEVVDSAHALSKAFRFWATPDSKTSWKALSSLGVDFINTDKPFECGHYLNSLPSRIYKNEIFSEVYKPSFEVDGKDKAPKNIILLIGDGNGLSQISATSIANGGQLSLTQLTKIGFLKTHSSDDLTTDSAAGATAMATGEKVPNRAIGVDNNGNSISNLTEILDKKGYSIGLITSDEITGATPASFYAHQKDRSMKAEILKDLNNSAVDVFAASSDSSSPKNEEFASFKLVKTLQELRMETNDKVGVFLASGPSPLPLSFAFTKVVDNLNRRKQPFFLMVEGAKIDSHGHGNNISGIIREGIAFDQAVAEALKFADEDENTLVIITADHETGGLSIPHGDLEQKMIEADFTTNDHSATMVPIFVYGNRSQKFQGVYENNELFHKIMEVLR